MYKTISIAVAVICMMVFSFKILTGGTKYSTNPIHSPLESKKWRIGYIQGGDYIDYKQTLLATVEGLIQLKWIEPYDIEKYNELEVEAIWASLVKDAESDYLQFVGDAFYTAKWISDLRENVMDRISRRIQEKDDIDLFIAMGTWAGQDLVKHPPDTNVLVMSASDPVVSGIIKSPYDSGAENLHVHIDPTFQKRQIQFFHDVIKFKKLGIIFENSDAGKSYAGIESANSLSKELGFKIVTCFAVSDISDISQREKAYLDCIDKIIPDIDAFYVTAHGGVTNNSIPEIVKKANRHKVPTFSQSGSKEVEQGLLMSLSRIDFKKVGMFQAAIMANVFNGAKPGELGQIFEEHLNISLNLDTAQNIAYIPSADIIAASDIIFQKK